MSHHEGDIVSFALIGKIEQITASGYVVNAHGVTLPILASQVLSKTEEDRARKKDIIRIAESALGSGNWALGDHMAALENALRKIIKSCEEQP